MIYANEYFESLEYEGPVLWPGDVAIWIRHDDVVHYQKKHHANCLLNGPAPCSTQPNPCELILYQSLTSTGTTGGDGLTGLTHAQKVANDHDADGDANDKMALPKYAQTHAHSNKPHALRHGLIHCAFCLSQPKHGLQRHHPSGPGRVPPGTHAPLAQTNSNQLQPPTRRILTHHHHRFARSTTTARASSGARASSTRAARSTRTTTTPTARRTTRSRTAPASPMAKRATPTLPSSACARPPMAPRRAPAARSCRSSATATKRTTSPT